LEDQCVITKEVTVAAGVFAPGHLGELTQIMPFELVDGAPRGAVVPDGGERPSISSPS
jgi:hypothetical protein